MARNGHYNIWHSQKRRNARRQRALKRVENTLKEYETALTSGVLHGLSTKGNESFIQEKIDKTKDHIKNLSTKVSKVTNPMSGYVNQD